MFPWREDAHRSDPRPRRLPEGPQRPLHHGLPSGRVVINGLEGGVLSSRDDGRSVTSRSLPSRDGVSTALPLADGGVLRVGEFGVRRLAD